MRLIRIAGWVFAAGVVTTPAVAGQHSGSVEASTGTASAEAELVSFLQARRQEVVAPRVAHETTLGNVTIAAEEVWVQGDRSAPIEAAGNVAVTIAQQDDSVVTFSTDRMTAVRAPYTDEAMKERVTGTVLLEVAVGPEGAFEVLSVIQHLGYGLDESATRAVGSWKMEPGPVSRHLTQIEVPFFLR